MSKTIRPHCRYVIDGYEGIYTCRGCFGDVLYFSGFSWNAQNELKFSEAPRLRRAKGPDYSANSRDSELYVLRATVDRYKAALEQYADPESWRVVSGQVGFRFFTGTQAAGFTIAERALAGASA